MALLDAIKKLFGGSKSEDAPVEEAPAEEVREEAPAEEASSDDSGETKEY